MQHNLQIRPRNLSQSDAKQQKCQSRSIDSYLMRQNTIFLTNKLLNQGYQKSLVLPQEFPRQVSPPIPKPYVYRKKYTQNEFRLITHSLLYDYGGLKQQTQPDLTQEEENEFIFKNSKFENRTIPIRIKQQVNINEFVTEGSIYTFGKQEQNHDRPQAKDIFLNNVQRIKRKYRKL